ncbi:MAG: hypothetical protein O9353_08970, partial [Bacteroidia bacterium]|nr:hypothetical protein [Bacteroidia bacterium]
MTEYDYAAYKNYRQNWIIRDTVFYNKPVQLAVDNKFQSYTVNEKNYCGNYFSTATYNGDSVMISGYFIDKHDTVYLAVSDQEQQKKAIGSEIVIQIKKNVVFPKDERKKRNTGKVYTTFVLNEQGK